MRIYSQNNNQTTYPDSIKYLEGEFKIIEDSSTPRYILMELSDDSSRKLAAIVKGSVPPEGDIYFDLIIIDNDDQQYFEKGQPGAVVTNDGMQLRATNVNRAHFTCALKGYSANYSVTCPVEIKNIVFYLDGIEPLSTNDNGKNKLNYEGVRAELYQR